MKGTFTIIVALGFIIILMLCDTFFFQKNNLTPISSPVVKLENGISQKVIKSETDTLVLDIKYPQTSNISVNNMIESFIIKQVNDFKSQIANAPIIENLKNKMYGRYVTSFFPANIVSFVFNISETNSGATQPNPIVITKTYDLRQNKELTLSDIFKPDSDYINQISALAIADIIDNLPSEQVWATELAGPIAKNFQNFTVSEEGITFYWSDYDMIGYVNGTHNRNNVYLNWVYLDGMLLPPFDTVF